MRYTTVSRIVAALCVAVCLHSSIYAVCPSYTKKTALTAAASAVPVGLFMFTNTAMGGIYISPTTTYSPQRIPTTQSDKANSIQISDDGDWVIFHDRTTDKSFVLRRDGLGRTEVPIRAQSNGTIRYPKTVGFVRNSPRGNEIFYVYNEKTVLGLKVAFTQTGATFSEERTIINFSSSNHMIECSEGVVLAVVRDQVFGRIDLTSPAIGRNGFVTIPNNGLGIATGVNVFKWKNDDLRNLWGCGHAMSANGQYCVSNSSQVGSAECVPNALNGFDHKGFYMTPFFRQDHAAITTNEQIDVYGTSINWVPSEYRFGTWSEVNFDHWSFAPNSNDWVIGCQFGTRSPIKGIWLVRWSTNTWHLLTNPAITSEIKYPVVYFGKTPGDLPGQGDTATDTTRPPTNTLGYRVEYPNGGETFRTGDTVRIRVSAPENSQADLAIMIGEEQFRVPGVTETFNPKLTTSITMIIPQNFYYTRLNATTGQTETVTVSAVSNQVKIRLFNYQEQSIYDESDGYFSITQGPNSARARATPLRLSRAQTYMTTASRITLAPGARSCRILALDGTVLYEATFTPEAAPRVIELPHGASRAVLAIIGE